MESREQTRFWQASALCGVELLQARYLQQRFAPHVHEGFVFTVIEHGAQRFRHRGSDHLAPQGSMVLINPDEVHTGSKAHDDGWRYRGFYPDNAQVLGALQELGLARSGMPSFAVSVLDDPRLHTAFLQLHRLLEDGAEALQQQLAWREAILLLFQHHGRVGEAAAPGREPWAVSCAKQMLAEQLLEPPSLEELAAAVNLSPFHFARVFRRATGLPPMPGSSSGVSNRRGRCSGAVAPRSAWPRSWASPTRATCRGSSSRSMASAPVSTARPV